MAVSVIDRETREVIETRTGSQGGSGGEKEIIASYVLTASLSYALCPDGSSRPLFGTIVLDEAFPRSSHGRADHRGAEGAYNKDRQRPSIKSSGGEPPIPIVYDGRQAYITFEDGSRLNARPALYLGINETYDFPVVYAPAARPSPYHINSDEVQRNIPKMTNNKRYGSACVIFQTDKFDADSKWTIHLGAL